MTSDRHNAWPEDEPDAAYLDAARASILAVGWRRTTLTDVARRAGVSRMTIYRRWADMRALLGDLLVREWSGLLGEALLHPRVAAQGTARTALTAGVTGAVGAVRDDPLFRKIVEVDPELLLPYLVERRGRTQDQVLDLLVSAVAGGQRDGSVRAGDPAVLARGLLLAVQGFVLSAAPMSAGQAGDPALPAVGLEQLDAELGLLVERYLRP